MLIQKFVLSLLLLGLLVIGKPLYSELVLSQPPPISIIYHPVSTSSPEAQASFNRGMTAIYGFNHDLAFMEFQKASQIDPGLAMAYWGMALSLGQNINQDITPENEKRAYGYIQQAKSLMANASEVERAYINALAVRYTNDPSEDLIPLRSRYRDAMKRLSASYPEDLDAAFFYAESLMNINPWRYWTWDGKPSREVLEAIAVCESILRRDPAHVGANHFYIHAWESSPTPERALLSAFRLTTLLPESGHILHMPCHIFILCGYYTEAIDTSHKAIFADRQYIEKFGMGGNYPLHYLKHNLRVLARACMLAEQYDEALKTASELDQFLKPYYGIMPDLEKTLVIPLEVNLYFNCWSELIQTPRPATENAYVLAYWHFSRAMAYIHLGEQKKYEQERDLMLEAKSKISPSDSVANNPARQSIDILQTLLEASLAENQGRLTESIDKFKQAVDKQDRLNYDEPPALYIPLRLLLGKALLKDNRPKEAEEVFRKGLGEYQRNPRLLAGLATSLRKQDRIWDAYWIERELKSALNGKDCQLPLDPI